MTKPPATFWQAGLGCFGGQGGVVGAGTAGLPAFPAGRGLPFRGQLPQGLHYGGEPPRSMTELALPTAHLADLSALIGDARRRAARNVNAELSTLFGRWSAHPN